MKAVRMGIFRDPDADGTVEYDTSEEIYLAKSPVASHPEFAGFTSFIGTHEGMVSIMEEEYHKFRICVYQPEFTDVFEEYGIKVATYPS